MLKGGLGGVESVRGELRVCVGGVGGAEIFLGGRAEGGCVEAWGELRLGGGT